jgi:hypothetical protein
VERLGVDADGVLAAREEDRELDGVELRLELLRGIPKLPPLDCRRELRGELRLPSDPDMWPELLEDRPALDRLEPDRPELPRAWATAVMSTRASTTRTMCEILIALLLRGLLSTHTPS